MLPRKVPSKFLRCWGGCNEDVVGLRLTKVRIEQDTDCAGARERVETSGVSVYDEHASWTITDSMGRASDGTLFATPELAIAETFKLVQPPAFAALWAWWKTGYPAHEETDNTPSARS